MQCDARDLGMHYAGLHSLAESVVYWGGGSPRDYRQLRDKTKLRVGCYNTYDVIRFLAQLLQNAADTSPKPTHTKFA